jgi:two-component system, OmpR family, response regulator
MAKKEKKVRIFSALEVADICGVVNQTAINWIKNGFLKAFMTPGGQYRVYAEDLLSFLSSRGMRVPEGLVESTESGPAWERLHIVDDDENINMLLKRYLSRLSPTLTVLQAFDGFEAGKLISESRPGVILLDINLPGIDGHKLCRRIKEDPTLGAPIIIAITGIADEGVGERIIGEGADAFLRKPLDFDKLWSTIEELTASRSGKETAG